MPVIEIQTADWAQVLDPKYRYIFIRGGRSSGKSHETGQYLALRSFTEENLKVLCLREFQSSIEKSSKTLIENKINGCGLGSHYSSIKSEIRKNRDDGLFYFQGMNDLTADNIKSLEGFDVCWFEEAQNCSRNSLKTLRPTIRKGGSQLIFTWNPKFPDDPIDEFCDQMRNEEDCLVIDVNFDDNPFLEDVVYREVEIDRKNMSHEDFLHIWYGHYDTSFHGHYYAPLIEEAKAQNRVTNVPRKNGVDIITSWDLGRADSTAIWVAQIVGREVRIIDYYEDSYKDLSHYAEWIKSNNYNGFHGLPHDARHSRLGMKGSIQDQLRTMGLTKSAVLPAMNKSAGRLLAKSLIKEAYFDKERCKDGLKVLRDERSVKNEKTGKDREIHEQDGAAAFRYLAQLLNTEHVNNKTTQQAEDDAPYSGSGWMG